MKAILHIPTEVLTAAVATLEANNGYYASLCGSQRVYDDDPRKELGPFNGLEVIRVAPWANKGHAAAKAVQLGFTPGPEGAGVWVRSSGTWIAIFPKDGYLVACGARHSVRELLTDSVRQSCYDWRYLETQRDDLAPWETATP